MLLGWLGDKGTNCQADDLNSIPGTYVVEKTTLASLNSPVVYDTSFLLKDNFSFSSLLFLHLLQKLNKNNQSLFKNSILKPTADLIRSFEPKCFHI